MKGRGTIRKQQQEMDTLPPLCLECIAEHLCDSYDPMEPLVVARDAGNYALVSRGVRKSLALPLYGYLDPNCVKDRKLPEAKRSELGCPVRQLVRACILAEVKEPYTMVTASQALKMGLAPEMLARLTCEVEMSFPLAELDFEPSYLADDIGPVDFATWQAFADPNYPSPTRKYSKLDVLKMLAEAL